MINFLSFKRNKLIRRFNYIKWKNNTDLFLEINSYISYINGFKFKLNKTLYYSIKTSRNKESDKETSVYDLDLFFKRIKY
jgi:hypothetical protein